MLGISREFVHFFSGWDQTENTFWDKANFINLPSCSVIVMFGKWGEKGGISSDLSSEGFGKSDAKAGEV